MAGADDQGALPPHVVRITAEREARRKHAEDAVRILTVARAASDCGDGRFPYIFEPWRESDAVHTWSARVDWAAYGPRWISECVVPFVAVLRDVAAYFSLGPRTLLPLTVTAHDKNLADRMTFALDQVIRLVDGADSEQVGRYVGDVMDADGDAWRHYHLTFDVISRRLVELAKHVERGTPVHQAVKEHEQRARGAAAASVFRRDTATHWILAFDGRSVTVEHRRGLELVQKLLLAGVEGVPVDVLDGRPVSASAGQPALDRVAKERIAAAIAALRREIADAHELRDEEREAHLLGELQQLEGQLDRDVGLGGKDRLLGSDRVAARGRCGAAISEALRYINESHPSLAGHLRQSIKTPMGYRPAYRPPRRIEWDTGAVDPAPNV